VLVIGTRLVLGADYNCDSTRVRLLIKGH